MMEINISSHSDNFPAMRIYPDSREVLIKRVFLGVGFESEDGESLSVSERDGGFEIIYGDKVFRLQGGQITELVRRSVQQIAEKQRDLNNQRKLNMQIDALHGPGASDALDAALKDGSIFNG